MSHILFSYPDIDLEGACFSFQPCPNYLADIFVLWGGSLPPVTSFISSGVVLERKYCAIEIIYDSSYSFLLGINYIYF